MATDSTELTFVRCPHCRSLVPAMSKVCRMCGEPLDGAAKEDSDAHKSGRIRQRTMSRPNDELNQAASKLRSEMSAPTVETGQAPAAMSASASAGSTSSDPVSEDPLSAYIQEIAVTDNGPQAKAAAPAQKPAAAPTPPAPVAPKAEVSAESDPLGMFLGQAIDDQPKTAATSASPAINANAESAAQPANSEAPQKPRVFVESGNRKPGKSPGLSFGRPKETKPEVREPAPEVEHTPPPRQAERPVAAMEDFADLEEAPHTEPAVQEQKPIRNDRPSARPAPVTNAPLNARTPTPVAPAPTEQRTQDRAVEFKRHEPAASPRAVNEQSTRNEPAKMSDAVSGRLFGWLVSYSDPDGVSAELREGKFFVSRSSLKPSDLIIDDASISTPHALVMVTSEHGLRIQDLMSDRGVFVRSRENDTYQRIQETVEIKHGDWVRFGDIEYLVALIAHVGSR